LRTTSAEMRLSIPYYAGFEPFAIRTHNEEVLREVASCAPRRLPDKRGPKRAEAC
jgi:hypothetical protein